MKKEGDSLLLTVTAGDNVGILAGWHHWEVSWESQEMFTSEMICFRSTEISKHTPKVKNYIESQS